MSTPEEIAESILTIRTPEGVRILQLAMEEAAANLAGDVARTARNTARELAETTITAAEGVSDTAIAAAEEVSETAVAAAWGVSQTVIETARVLADTTAEHRATDKSENVALLMAINRMQRIYTATIVVVAIFLTIVIVAANIWTTKR